MTKRPFADVAIAFANGEAIQYKANHRPAEWLDWPHPWFPSFTPSAVGIHDYRIKPQKVWRWVFYRQSYHNHLQVTDDWYPSKQAFEDENFGLVGVQPILFTEKEM